MARFRFQLEGVLRQRKTVEQQRHRELAEVQVVYTQAEAELRALDASVQANNDDVKQNHLTGRLNLSFIAAHRRYMGAMQRKAVEIAQRMAGIMIKVDEARKALAEAARQRKIFEKLREKQFEEWRTDQARRELAALDEVNMQLSYRELREAEWADEQRETNPPVVTLVDSTLVIPTTERLV